jgi:hypothetical protein
VSLLLGLDALFTNSFAAGVRRSIGRGNGTSRFEFLIVRLIMSSRSRSLVPVGSTSGGPVGRDGDGVKVLRSGNRCVTGRVATSTASAKSARWESIGGQFCVTEIIGQHWRGDILPSSVGGDGGAGRPEKKSVLRQVDRQDVHWQHGLGD